MAKMKDDLSLIVIGLIMLSSTGFVQVSDVPHVLNNNSTRTTQSGKTPSSSTASHPTKGKLTVYTTDSSASTAALAPKSPSTPNSTFIPSSTIAPNSTLAQNSTLAPTSTLAPNSTLAPTSTSTLTSKTPQAQSLTATHKVTSLKPTITTRKEAKEQTTMGCSSQNTEQTTDASSEPMSESSTVTPDQQTESESTTTKNTSQTATSNSTLQLTTTLSPVSTNMTSVDNTTKNNQVPASFDNRSTSENPQQRQTNQTLKTTKPSSTGPSFSSSHLPTSSPIPEVPGNVPKESKDHTAVTAGVISGCLVVFLLLLGAAVLWLRSRKSTVIRHLRLSEEDDDDLILNMDSMDEFRSDEPTFLYK